MKDASGLAHVLLLRRGCGAAWRKLERPALASDIAGLCRRAGVEANLRDCRMAGTARTGSCALTLNHGDVRRLTAGLGLLPRPGPPPGLALPAGLAPESGALHYFAGRRPAVLRPLAPGGAGEFVHLACPLDTGQALPVPGCASGLRSQWPAPTASGS